MRKLNSNFFFSNALAATVLLVLAWIVDIRLLYIGLGVSITGVLVFFWTELAAEEESHREFVLRIQKENRELDRLLYGFEVRVHEKELIEEQKVITQVYNDHSYDRGNNWLFSSGTLHIYRQKGAPYLHLPSDLDESELKTWSSTYVQ